MANENVSPLARPGDTNWFTAGMAGPVMNERGQVLFDGGKTWTAAPPSEMGNYYAKFKDDSEPEIVLVDYKFRVWRNAYLSSLECQISDFTHWLGPLPVLQPPKE